MSLSAIETVHKQKILTETTTREKESDTSGKPLFLSKEEIKKAAQKPGPKLD